MLGTDEEFPPGEDDLMIGSPSLAESRMPKRKAPGKHACGARSHWRVRAVRISTLLYRHATQAYWEMR
jgi:hypothetical protein